MDYRYFITILGSFSMNLYGAETPPNIIIFLVDDMGLMDTSLPFIVDSSGNPVRYPLNDWYRTPNMERMASQGIRFSTFYAQNVSSPTRASLMTGQNAARHGVTNWIDTGENNRGKYGPLDWNWNGLDDKMILLPRVLKDNGYRTIHIGKSHFGRIGCVGDNPLNLGFDVKIGDVTVGPRSYLGEKNFGYKGIDDQYFPKGLEKYAGKDIFLTEALTLEAINQMNKASDSGIPFFLYMSHYAVHAPFVADNRFINNYNAEDNSKSQGARAYASMVEGMDKSLGDIMNYLIKKGIDDNTLILFIGDNGSDAPLGDEKGYSSSSPFRGKKGSEYEGGNRVPFIVSWGEKNLDNIWQKKLPINPNTIQNQMGTVMDVFPTLLSLLGISTPADVQLDGYDLTCQISGKFNEKRPERMLVHFPHEHRGSYFTTYREGDWKLIYYYNPEMPRFFFCELYNLKKDPYEIHNYATTKTSKLREMIKKMSDELKRNNAKYPIDADGNVIYPLVE